MTKEKRREIIASNIGHEISSVPPSRLLTLLNQSLKWQQSHGLLPVGSKLDLFKGTVSSSNTLESFPIKNKLSTIKFPKGHRAECLSFSNDGHTLATGSADGFIEIWNYNTGKLRKDLHYQASDELMMMEQSVLCVCFSSDGKLVASGSQDGQIKIWRISDGTCSKKFTSVHPGGVLSVFFSPDKSYLASCGFDHTIK
ncbi:WD40 repeat-containing protein SMU1 [Smittium culicis]|uniref:WD40 repeat-containing protein SMU1 n=1 Tax=Smittium culicis TaxID=133412 RepID=A0A1R1YI98_9FUNG|nr:WD40 repeat-containing protein SMU1 [Smittium culicis]